MIWSSISLKIGLALVAAGVMAIGIGVVISEPLDVPIAWGWHVTVFAPGTLVGVPTVVVGTTMLAVTSLRARRSARRRV